MSQHIKKTEIRMIQRELANRRQVDFYKVNEIIMKPLNWSRNVHIFNFLDSGGNF